MSRLLASSRLSSYHPKTGQVYTAPPSYISRGDFGVKRPLPTSHLKPGMIRYVEIGNQDTQQGQTVWSEKEREVILLKRFSELNVRLDSSEVEDTTLDFLMDVGSKQGIKMGSLGPKISTTYDPSTRRAVPTNYDGIPNEDMKAYLQSEAKVGRGPLYVNMLHGGADGGAFGRASQGYTSDMKSRVNFRSMNEKQFEKFLEGIRSRRELFKDHLGSG
jgi:hypothetical protein